jgi:tellurite methyltransferase
MRSDALPSAEIEARFGDIDIYLFDQLARGRFDARRRVLDVGCGKGRNLRYLLARGYDCHGLDRDRRAIARLRREASGPPGSVAPGSFLVGLGETLPWPDLTFDAAISSAVLHFATDRAHFGTMVTEMWRVRRPAFRQAGVDHRARRLCRRRWSVRPSP